jgi:cobyrinic acid a,c-diamide synthase
MIQWMTAALSSGSGKTVVTSALLRAMQNRGLDPCAFKCGPDYIDPMFHRAALGVPSHNLDLFLMGEHGARANYGRYAAGHGAALTEGVMGYYDGLGGTTPTASAWDTARLLDLPVLLVLRPKGTSLTLAAQVKGLQAFRTPNQLAGLFLNDCSPMLARTLAPLLERETGLPVLGHLPPMEEARLESRHLGLQTTHEIQDLQKRLDTLAEALEASLDWARFCTLGERTPPDSPCSSAPRKKAVIAVARDEAFSFCYAETLDALADAGGEVAFFSPLRDRTLPAGTQGLYLPGGYPELYAKTLADNRTMLTSIREQVGRGLPTVAECGGFLYLSQSLAGTDGEVHPMVGVLPGRGTDQGKLVRFGYAHLTASSDSLLFRQGETLPVHEFHHWDTDANGTDLTFVKPLTGRTWTGGWTHETLYAAFPHLFFGGTLPLAERFVDRAAVYIPKE